MNDLDENISAPTHMKEMLSAEIDIIRDVMQIVKMFISEPVAAGITLMQELENKNKSL